MKWNTAPLSNSIDLRGVWVSAKTGIWNGGASPHQPHCQSSPKAILGGLIGRRGEAVP